MRALYVIDQGIDVVSYFPYMHLRGEDMTAVAAGQRSKRSADNPHSQDPTRDVTFGEQSTDEMMFGEFDFTPKNGVSPRPAARNLHLSPRHG